MIADKSWESSKLCLVLNRHVIFVPIRLRIGVCLLHVTKPPLRLSSFLTGEAHLPFWALTVSLCFIHTPSNEMRSHTHASHFAHNALVMGCFWTVPREQWFTASGRVRLKPGAYVPECHRILRINYKGNLISNYALGLHLRLGCSSQEFIL